MASTGNYFSTYLPGHHTVQKRSGMVLDHVLVAEKALGRYLPKGTIVHHHDENGQNNLNTNLVICQDQKYHKLLHTRMKVLKAGGDPNKDKICCTCKKLFNKSTFNSNLSMPDGLQPACQGCCSSLRRKYPQYR